MRSCGDCSRSAAARPTCSRASATLEEQTSGMHPAATPRLMTLYFLGLAALVAAGLSALLLRHRPVLADRSYGLLAGTGCVLAALPAVRVLAGGPAVEGQLGSWAFGIDLLSAAFLLVVLVPGLASALYGVRTRSAARMLFVIELAALALVVTARTCDSVPHRLGSDGGARLLPGDVRARARRGAAGGARVPRRDPHRHAGPARDVRLLGRAYRIALLRRASRSRRLAARRRGSGAVPRAVRIRAQGRPRAAALLAAGRARIGAIARLGVDVGRGDQDGDLRAVPRG